MRWITTLVRALAFTVVAAIIAMMLYPVFATIGFLTEAAIGEMTGWYRVEDYMCTIPEGCDEYIAERKRLRENRTDHKSN